MDDARPGGQFVGLLVSDYRDKDDPRTYLAERAILQETEQGPMLFLRRGNIQRQSKETGAVEFVRFEELAVNIASFQNQRGELVLELTERYPHELLNPDMSKPYDQINAGKLIAEGHSRYAGPLYAFAYVLVGLYAMIGGPYNRRHYVFRIAIAGAVIFAIRVGGYVAQGMAETSGAYWTLYGLPGGAILLFAALLFAPRPRSVCFSQTPFAGRRLMPPITLFRYIALRAVFGIGGLLLILACLVLLIDLIENMRFANHLGEGNFGFAVMLTLLRAPSLTQALVPFVFLFGSIWMFNQLNRRSEISVMRSAGLSVWRLLAPAAFIAALSGVVIITVIDPISSNMLAYAEIMKSEKQGKERNLVRVFNDGIWLRQRDETGQILINAAALDEPRTHLEVVTVWRFNAEGAFQERIDAPRAALAGRTLELQDAKLNSIAEQEPIDLPVYAIMTALSAEDLRERVTPPETMSLWQLPHFIELANSAGLPTTRYLIRFHDLSSTPLKLLAMVLIAAAFSMRPTRMGGVFHLIIFSIGAGFLLYILSEVSTALGESELAPVALAAWTPAVIATIAAVTALLHLEDG